MKEFNATGIVALFSSYLISPFLQCCEAVWLETNDVKNGIIVGFAFAMQLLAQIVLQVEFSDAIVIDTSIDINNRERKCARTFCRAELLKK